MRACNKQRSKIPLGTKGRTSILSTESSASCGASFSVSRRKLHDREWLRHFVPSRWLYPLAPRMRLSPVDFWQTVRRQQVYRLDISKSSVWSEPYGGFTVLRPPGDFRGCFLCCMQIGIPSFSNSLQARPCPSRQSCFLFTALIV